MLATNTLYTQLTPGTIISYVLRLDEHPINPLRQWKGKVICKGYKSSDGKLVVWVESLEPGYSNEREWIFLEQVVEVKG